MKSSKSKKGGSKKYSRAGVNQQQKKTVGEIQDQGLKHQDNDQIDTKGWNNLMNQATPKKVEQTNKSQKTKTTINGANSKNFQAKKKPQQILIFLERAMVQRYQIQIKEQISNLNVSQIQSKVHLLKKIQLFFDILKTQNLQRPQQQKISQVKIMLMAQQLVTMTQSIAHLETYLIQITRENLDGFQNFLAKEMTYIETNLITPSQIDIIQSQINLFSNEQMLETYQYVSKEYNSLHPHFYQQAVAWNKYTPNMKNIVLIVQTLFKDIVILLKRQKIRIYQQGKDAEKNNFEKQINRINKKQQKMRIFLEQADKKIQKQVFTIINNNRDIISLTEQIKKLENSLFNKNLQKDEIVKLLEGQKLKAIQMQKLLKSCINTAITFASNLNQNLLQEVANTDFLLSQESILDLSTTNENFSCSQSIMKIKVEQKDSIQEWSMLKDLKMEQKIQQLITKASLQLKQQQISQYESALRNIKENVQQGLAKIKYKYIKEILSRQKKLKYKYKNNPHKNSLIESSHLKIQLNFVKQEKQAIIKKLTQKSYELSLVNEKLQEMSVQLECAHDTINNLKTKMLQVDQALKKETKKLQGLRKINQNYQQKIEDLQLKYTIISLNQEQREAYLVKKTLDFTQLKCDYQKNVSITNSINQRLIDIQIKFKSLQTEKQMILLAKRKLNRQTQNLKEKCQKFARINTDYQFQIQELRYKLLNKNNQSLILQKVTQADTSIEEEY